MAYIPVPPWQRKRHKKRRSRRLCKRHRFPGEAAMPRWCQILRAARRRKFGDTVQGRIDLCQVLSDWAGVPLTTSTQQRWESGHGGPHQRYYTPLAKIMDLTTDQLIELLWPRPGGPIDVATRDQQAAAEAERKAAQVGEGDEGPPPATEG